MLQTLSFAAAYGGPARPALRSDTTRALGVRLAATNPLLAAADRLSYQGEVTLPATREPLPVYSGRVVAVRPRRIDVRPIDLRVADELPAATSAAPALGGLSPGALLQKYGTLYLVTSTALSVVSFALCYVAVAHALRSGGLPAWCTLAASRSGRAGLFGIAYATHKVRHARTSVPPALSAPYAVLRLLVTGALSGAAAHRACAHAAALEVAHAKRR